ncbi:MAG: c-type cytochrome [Hyphomicrobiales bacterium]
MLALTFSLLAAPPASAQQRSPEPWKGKNLRVLPKNTTREQIHETMEGFSMALGVRCSHCHAQDKKDPRHLDFPSDENPNKNIARAMFRMAGDVRRDLSKIKFTESNRVNFGCVTCHHGIARPMTLAQTLHETYATSGIDSTLSQYHALRDRYYGSGAYDFDAASLNDVGHALLQEKKTDDAIAIFQLNVGQNSQDTDAYAGLGDGYREAGKNDLAIENYKKALELEPRNRDAEEALKALTGGSDAK